MLYEEILEKEGFRRMGNQYAVKPVAGLDALVRQDQDTLTMSVPCASPLVDYEKEINDYLKTLSADYDGMTVDFGERQMRLKGHAASGEDIESLLDKMQSLVRAIKEKYDLLPVCMCCGRIGTVTVQDYFGNVRVICGICADEQKLHHEHQEQVEQQRMDAKKEMYLEAQAYHPVYRCLKIGVKGGLYTCAVGLVFFLISAFLPMFHYLVTLKAAFTAVYVVDRLWEVKHLPMTGKFVFGTFSAFVTISAVSGLFMLLFCKLTGYSVVQPMMLFSDMVAYNLVFGFIGYAVMSFIMILLKRAI